MAGGKMENPFQGCGKVLQLVKFRIISDIVNRLDVAQNEKSGGKLLLPRDNL
jgi:hypothetical protein